MMQHSPSPIDPFGRGDLDSGLNDEAFLDHLLQHRLPESRRQSWTQSSLQHRLGDIWEGLQLAEDVVSLFGFQSSVVNLSRRLLGGWRHWGYGSVSHDTHFLLVGVGSTPLNYIIIVYGNRAHQEGF